MSAWVRLTARQKAQLDEALEPAGLTRAMAFFLEAHLTSYHHRHRAPTAADRRALATAGRRLMTLMAQARRDDDVDGDELLVGLVARVAQWEKATSDRRPAHRPVDDARRLLLSRVLGVLDDAGLPWKRRSWHRDGPRVRALRVVLQIADALDGVPITDGSLRLIRDLQRRRSGAR
jgi:hypothetical protein